MKERTFQFAVSVGKLVSQLPYSPINKPYISQLIRSSSSVGANYRSSQRAKSDSDFINKLKIVEEEADESVYFLQLLLAFNESYQKQISPLIDEGIEILKIIVSSIVTIRNKKQSKIA